MSLRQTEDGAPVAVKHLNAGSNISNTIVTVHCVLGQLLVRLADSVCQKVHTLLPASRGAECCFGIRG